ncbi:MAG: plasmid recombination protein [Ruminococcus flavefaciens]|nr:plasmid recombination protein [Ruminococcus flavefaciens]
MSIGICRVQKINGTSGGVGAYFHNERIKDHSNSNPDINFSRSAENYHVGEYADALSYNQRTEKRLAEGYKGKRAVRKDAVKLVEVLFTSDKAFFDAQADNGRAYFKDCLKWASERFGEDNIIADVVHLDEATPHMHLDFVPLTADGRLSAKELLGDKKRLQQLQDDFYEKVGRKYGLDRGIRANLDTGEAGRPHLTTEELKAETLKKGIKELEVCRENMAAEVKSLSKRSVRLNKDVLGLKADKDTLQGQISALEGNLDVLEANDIIMMRRFIERPKIAPLYEEFRKAMLKRVQDRPEQRRSIRAKLSRYQAEIDARDKPLSVEERGLKETGRKRRTDQNER